MTEMGKKEVEAQQLAWDLYKGSRLSEAEWSIRVVYPAVETEIMVWMWEVSRAMTLKLGIQAKK
jgi:hypothetical protein